jgi:hypothetical protein
VGPGTFCTTMHRCILRALSKLGIPELSFLPYSHDLAPADFFISYIKNCDERVQILGYLIDPTDCDERTEGDTGRSVFSSTRFVANVVSKWAGTILSEVLIYIFNIVCVGFMALLSELNYHIAYAFRMQQVLYRCNWIINSLQLARYCEMKI